MMILRADIVRVAGSWIGTPYRHRASLKGVGCDCLGFIIGVYREFHGALPEEVPPYSRDWSEAFRRDALREGCRRHLVPVVVSEALPGDILLFRVRPDWPARHAAFKEGEDSILHALEGYGVMRARLSGAWARRLTAAFAFPGVEL